jgi:hypothetical protein
VALTEVCSHCGFHQSAHYGNCPRIAAAVLQMSVPQPTAYERDQQALRADLKAAFAEIVTGRERLDAALRRIEALELEVAKLKGPTRLSRCPVVGCTVADCSGLHVIGGPFASSPATAYPPLPDEGT